PDMIRSEGVDHVEHIFRGTVCQRFGSTTLSLHSVARRLGVDQFKPALFADRKAGDRIVPTVCGKQKLAIWREDDATCAFKGVGCALLTADRLKSPRTRTTSGDTFHLRQRAV